jgi:hypothetical protein
MNGDNLINTQLINSAGVDCISGYNSINGSLHALIYDTLYKIPHAIKQVKLVIKNITPLSGKKIKIKTWIINEKHNSWWYVWQSDKTLHGINNSSYIQDRSEYANEVPWALSRSEDIAFWQSNEAHYRQISKLSSTTIDVPIINHTITLTHNLQSNAVLFYELLNIKNLK